ncbi:TPM domain-containing protein [Janthinobacterium sp. PSPC3-1]|uniref:TPM domain-containing protein n=1 Tax=Janthinobacterium sp. PSPC3-1 TaxID=2804653 RepID=UPI003CE8D5F1
MISPRLSRLWTWLCALCLMAMTLAHAATPLPILQSHVNDYAGVLAARGPAIDATLKTFETQSGHQVFVLTVDRLPADTSIDAYAVAVFEQWQPGRKGRDDGALLVIATGDRKMRIETGYGLEDKLTDLHSARIVREVITPRFQQGDIEGGVADGVDAMLAVISGQPAAAPLAGAKVANKEISGAAKWIVLGLFGFLLLFALGMSLFAGVFGLLASVIVAVSVVLLFASDWRGWIIAGTVVLAWLLLRWWMVANNVRKYHLPKARNQTLAWLGVYLFSLGFARGGPQKKRERNDRRSGGGTSGGGSSGGSGTSGGGGRSGGGGASGSW